MSLTKASYSMITGAVANVLDYGATGNGTTDDTAAIQAAIDSGKDVYLPTGAYLVNPDTGLVVKNGTTLFGEGKANSIIVAKANTGGTVAELAAYAKGSVIKRAFNPSSANSYVSYVNLHDFAVVLNQPTASVTTTAIQIGIDLRNITRSSVRRVWVGNIAPTDQTVYVKADPTGGYQSQGYGIVCGNVSSGSASYAGGEVNSISECNVVGAYKNIVIDDADLSPLSSVHSTSVERCDIQSGHMLLIQEQRYTAGTYFYGNTVQNIVKQPGNANQSFVLRLDGYNGFSREAYIEAAQNVDYLLYLGTNSKNNRVYMTYYSSKTGNGFITDNGDNNLVEYFASTATPPEIDSFGSPIYLVDGVYKQPYRTLWIKFHWTGSAIAIDGSSGNVSVVRNNAGDYTITYDKSFPSDDYAIAVTLDTNASGHGGLTSIGTHSASNMRLYTYAQNAGTTTQLDPRFVWVQVSVN